jgi:hypothetical protein
MLSIVKIFARWQPLSWLAGARRPHGLRSRRRTREFRDQRHQFELWLQRHATLTSVNLVFCPSSEWL